MKVSKETSMVNGNETIQADWYNELVKVASIPKGLDDLHLQKKPNHYPELLK